MKSENARTDFKLFIEQKRNWYKKIGKIFCPVLNEHVIFNAKGFYHLRYDGLRAERNIDDQIRRFKLLHFVVHIIRKVSYISEHRIQYSKALRKDVYYWKIEKGIQGKHLVVILRKVGNGQITFYSIWDK